MHASTLHGVLDYRRNRFRLRRKEAAFWMAALAFLATTGRASADDLREPRVDRLGDPLPDGVVARIGSGRMRHDDGHKLQLAFAPDGKSLVSGGDSTVRIWDAATGKLRQRFKVKAGWDLAFAFTADGIAVASGDKKGTVAVQVFDTASGKVRRRIEMKERATRPNLTFSADGKGIAFTQGNTVRICDSATGQEILSIPTPGQPAEEIAFAPDGKTIALDAFGDTVRLHDSTTGKCVRELTRRELEQNTNHVFQLVFSPDGRFLASIPPPRPIDHRGEIDSIRIWDVKTGIERQRLKNYPNGIYCAAFSPNSQYLALGGDRLNVVLWDMAAGKEVRRCSIEPSSACSIAFSPDGQILAAATGDGAIWLWDVATGRVLPASADRFLQASPDLRFSADNRRLLGRDDTFIAWDPHTGREIRRMAQTAGAPWTLDLSPDETLLAGGDRKEFVHLWDATTGRSVRDLKVKEQEKEEGIRNSFFSSGGRRLVSCGYQLGTVRVWDVASGRQLYSFTSDRRTALAVSPDGRWLAAAFRENGRSEVLLWDLDAGRKKSVFALTGNIFVNHMTFSPDSRLLAIAGWSGQGNTVPSGVFLWDVASGQQERILDNSNKAVLETAFSADGRMVASGHFDGTLLLWELATGRWRHSFRGHESGISSLAFSPNGRLLAASSFDAPVYVWDVAGTIESGLRRLSNDELQHCWIALAGEDAPAAFQAIRRLAAAPEQTLPFLRERLRPVPAPNRERIRQLLDMLDSDDFPTRQKAAEELDKQSDAAAVILRQIVAKEKPSLEVRRRLQLILESIENKPESLRTVRTVEVLEWLATPAAVRFIEELAGGAADARLTREAAAAKRRLQR